MNHLSSEVLSSNPREGTQTRPRRGIATPNKKKNKQRKKNKKQAAAAVAASQPSQPKCFHGSTEDAFDPRGEYGKVVKEHLQIYEKASNMVEFKKLISEFDETHGQLLKDPGFGRFVFASAAEEYLTKGISNSVGCTIVLGINVRYLNIPIGEGTDFGRGSENGEKVEKYMRDVETERGVINCLARETPCDCMKKMRTKAKSMEKVAVCCGCKKKFPKEQTFICSGCRMHSYCSRECQLEDWPTHMASCIDISKKMATGQPHKEVENRLDRRDIKTQICKS